jgi:hypothetical protein
LEDSRANLQAGIQKEGEYGLCGNRLFSGSFPAKVQLISQELGIQWFIRQISSFRRIRSNPRSGCLIAENET